MSAIELSIILRMMANQGTFGGVEILKPETIQMMWT